MAGRFKPPAQAAVVNSDGRLTAAWTAYFQDTSDAVGALASLASGASYANDAAAAAGGVAIGSLYRNGSVVCVRVM